MMFVFTALKPMTRHELENGSGWNRRYFAHGMTELPGNDRPPVKR